MQATVITCTLHGDLVDLLAAGKNEAKIVYSLTRRASIKDIIESLGIPHTEVGRIELAGRQIGFTHIPTGGERFNVHPFTDAVPLLRPTILRPMPLASLTFMVDDTVRRLRRNMRMAGLDSESAPAGRLTDVARAANQQDRVLVSRNRELLKCRQVRFGQLIRSQQHIVQLGEVLRRYAIGKELLRPFSRCLACNSLLLPVNKEDILDRLEPLTKKYYFHFSKCPSCARIYWPGSHQQRMEQLLAEARSS